MVLAPEMGNYLGKVILFGVMYEVLLWHLQVPVELSTVLLEYHPEV